MKFLRIIKLKFFYLINKTILIVFVLILFLIMLAFLLEGINSSENNSYQLALELYNQNSFMYLKIIMTFFTVYLFSYSISSKNDFLIYLLMPIGVSKFKSFFSTIIVNVLIVFLMFIILFLLYNYIGSSLIKIYIFEMKYALAFLSIFFISLIYGLYSMILMQVLNNNFSIILVITLFILSNNYYENNEVSNIVLYLLPNVSTSGEIYLSIIYFAFYSFVLSFLSYYLYNKRDLNY